MGDWYRYRDAKVLQQPSADAARASALAWRKSRTVHPIAQALNRAAVYALSKTLGARPNNIARKVPLPIPTSRVDPELQEAIERGFQQRYGPTYVGASPRHDEPFVTDDNMDHIDSALYSITQTAHKPTKERMMAELTQWVKKRGISDEDFDEMISSFAEWRSKQAARPRSSNLQWAQRSGLQGWPSGRGSTARS